MSVLAKAPKWWDQRRHPLSYLLAPLGMVYGLVVKLRFALTKPYHSTLPVICIGNFTVGGGGKTPLAVELASLLIAKGHKPVILTRGYGGQIKGPHLVDLSLDSAIDVGDEPLILAQHARVVVCADRAKGARFIEQMDSDVILMDDGFQNPGLHKDLSLIVLDAASGIGNGRIFPAGPLRAELAFQLEKTGVLAIVDKGADLIKIEQEFAGEVFHLKMEPQNDEGWLAKTRVCVVSGIARPGKFYASLEKLGAVTAQRHEFPDHHMFGQKDAQAILKAAASEDLPIVMTQKDWVRLPKTDERGQLRKAARVLPVRMQIDEPQKLVSRLQKTISSNTKSAD